MQILSPPSIFFTPLLLLLSLTDSAPVETPNTDTIHYQPEPKTRGTVSLLFSCIVTLVLCVWTALHLNVEPLEFSRSKIAGASRVIGKIIWGFAALIVPEVVLSIALHQFLVARRYQTLLEMTEQPDEIADLGQPGSAINSAKDVSRYNSPPVSLPANEVPAPQSVHQNPLDDNTAGSVNEDDDSEIFDNEVHKIPQGDFEDNNGTLKNTYHEGPSNPADDFEKEEDPEKDETMQRFGLEQDPSRENEEKKPFLMEGLNKEESNLGERSIDLPTVSMDEVPDPNIFEPPANYNFVEGDVLALPVLEDDERSSVMDTARQKEDKTRGGLKKAFYAVMGGFAIDGAELGAVTLDIPLLVITATVAKIQQYPSAAIEDKSKADYLAKLLACIQAGWILLQCLGRKLSDLPITLLELNTVLHVLNAFVMYTLWWKKPLDVSQPSIIDQLERIETKKVFVGIGRLKHALRTVRDQMRKLTFHRHYDGRIGSASRAFFHTFANIVECSELDEIIHLESWVGRPKVLSACAGAVECLVKSGDLASSYSCRLDMDSAVNYMIHIAVIDTMTGAIEYHFSEYIKTINGGAFVMESSKAATKAVLDSFNSEFCSKLDNDWDYTKQTWAHGITAFGAACNLQLAENAPYGTNEAFDSLAEAFAHKIGTQDGYTSNAEQEKAQQHAVLATVRIAENLRFTICRNTDDILHGEASLTAKYHDYPFFVAARAKLFQMACSAAIKQEYPRSKEETLCPREQLYEEAFLWVRKSALEAAKACSHDIEKRTSACKAAFHLNPHITREDQVINRESRSLWKQLVATLTDGGRHVSNQIIWVPGLFDDGSNEMLSSFGATWCAIHRIIVMLFAVFTGSFYGGMHSLKWYDVFPTAMEQKLWRISTLVGAVGIIPLVAFAMIFLRIQRIRNSSRFYRRYRDILGYYSQPAEWISWIVVILFWICASLFLVARVFLVVESFISMRAVSEDSYKTVQWAEVLPHF